VATHPSDVERDLLRRIRQVIIRDDRERRELVLRSSPVGSYVEYAPAPNEQGVRGQPAVAAPPQAFGAHQRYGAGSGQLFYTRVGLQELRRGHVVGIALELLLTPAAIDRTGQRRAPSAQLPLVHVGDPLTRQLERERLRVEVRMPARARV